MASPFDHCASDYAVARPTYPDAVFNTIIEFLRQPANHPTDARRLRVIDLGAGTGIFTRQLARHGFSGMACDIGQSLLNEFNRDSETLPTTAGRWFPVCAKAEQLPVADNSVDLVTAAQSFHWFNPKLTFVEIGRVLKSEGVLALVWNNRDVTVCPFWRDYERLIEQFNPAYEREYREQDWSAKAEQSSLFSPMIERRFTWKWTLSCDQLLGYPRSISYIRNVLSSQRMGEFLEELTGLWNRSFGTNEAALDMGTSLYLAHGRPR